MQEAWAFIKKFQYNYEARNTEGRKPEHGNTGAEEDISQVFFWLGKRQNMPRNFLLLQSGLKILSSWGPAERLTQSKWRPRGAGSLLPTQNSAPQPLAPPQLVAISFVCVYTTEGVWTINLCMQGEGHYSVCTENRWAGIQMLHAGCSKPGDFRLTSGYRDFHCCWKWTLL